MTPQFFFQIKPGQVSMLSFPSLHFPARTKQSISSGASALHDLDNMQRRKTQIGSGRKRFPVTGISVKATVSATKD